MAQVSKKLEGRRFIFDGAAKEIGALGLGQETTVTSQDTRSVIFKGFSIEVLNFGYSLNVQDQFRKAVNGAHVYITDLVDFFEEGFTDRNGCYYGNADEDITHILSVTKEGHLNYSHRFRIISGTFLTFPANNFPVYVFDSSDVPIPGASVSITATGHSSSGTTDANGLFQGIVLADKINTITISKIGYTSYNQTVNPYLKITCSDNSLVAVPVIVLS